VKSVRSSVGKVAVVKKKRKVSKHNKIKEIIEN